MLFHNCFALSASAHHFFHFFYLLKIPHTIILKKSFFPVQFSACMASSLLSENDQEIDSPGQVLFSENEAAFLIHEELYLRIGPSILACPAPNELQTATTLFGLQEASLYDTRGVRKLSWNCLFAGSNIN